MTSALPLLKISGGPRERGRAHGEAFREEIGTLLPAYFDYLDRTSRSGGVDQLTAARALEIAGTYHEPAEAYASELLNEVRGIAEGANAPFEEVLALNAFLDLCDYLALGDHVDSPLSICRHDEVHDGQGCGKTICGIVLEPAEGRAWIARGPCCEHDWTEHRLG